MGQESQPIRHTPPTFLKQAANQNSPDACYAFAVLLWECKGASRDFNEAARYFRLAADHAHADGGIATACGFSPVTLRIRCLLYLIHNNQYSETLAEKPSHVA
jgi:TPR repeat protein